MSYSGMVCTFFITSFDLVVNALVCGILAFASHDIFSHCFSLNKLHMSSNRFGNNLLMELPLIGLVTTYSRAAISEYLNV